MSRRAVAAALALSAVVLGAQPAWLHAKAELAQWLLQRSWTRALQHGGVIAPWPGADTHPVARLSAPAHGADLIVLAGDSGRTLAFGPGWAEASAAPGAAGTAVISAHRDTHFAFLRSVQAGDVLWLESPRGRSAWRVRDTTVVDSRSTRIAANPAADRLLLVTCWPFDAVTAGGPLRYVVSAEPLHAASATEQLPTRQLQDDQPAGWSGAWRSAGPRSGSDQAAAITHAPRQPRDAWRL